MIIHTLPKDKHPKNRTVPTEMRFREHPWQQLRSPRFGYFCDDTGIQILVMLCKRPWRRCGPLMNFFNWWWYSDRRPLNFPNLFPLVWDLRSLFRLGVLLWMPSFTMCDIHNVQIILGVAFYLVKIMRCDILNNNTLACDILQIW